MPPPARSATATPTPAPDTGRSGRWAHLAAAIRSRPRRAANLAVAAAAVVAYRWGMGAPPFLDDGWTALQNPLVWKLSNAGRIFRELYGFAGPPSVRGPYRPLTTLSFALDYAVHGAWMPGFHLVNLALHVAASLLVVALAVHLARASVRTQGQATLIGLLAGLLFAVHPAHVEAVVTIYGRTEPLSAVFALGALLLALRARGAGGVALAALVLAAGILCKEGAATVPPLYALVAFALPAAAGLPARPGLARGAPRAALWRTAAVTAALALAFLPWLLGHAAASPHGLAVAVADEAKWFRPGTPALHVALTMSRVLGEYLRILAFPSFLGGDFAYAARIPTLTGPTWGFALATLWWLLVLGAGFALLRRAPLLGLGLLWIFVGLLPVSQIVPVGVLIAERLLYLPSVGFCLAAAGALALLHDAALRLRARLAAPGPAAVAASGAEPPLARGLRVAAWAIPALVVALLGARTVARTLDWQTAIAFWESEAQKAPHETVVNNNLAVAYTASGQPKKAISRLEIALADDPRYWRAWVNLGIARGLIGEWAGARAAYQRATELAPSEADPQRFLGKTLSAEGDLSGAVEALANARRLAPEQAVLARELAGVLLQAGRVAEARTQLEDAVRLDPADGASRAILKKLQ
jgi:tetratricopeptide (TPR) repeat protein